MFRILSSRPNNKRKSKRRKILLFLLLFFLLSICGLRPLDMLSLRSSSIYCRCAPIRYEINPSFAKYTYQKSHKGFISMRDTPLRVSRYLLIILVYIICQTFIPTSQKRKSVSRKPRAVVASADGRHNNVLVVCLNSVLFLDLNKLFKHRATREYVP